MATRGYPPPQHHYQQRQGPPPVRQYDHRPDPRYQDPRQRMPPQRDPQYDGYQDQYAYQNEYGYEQQGQYYEQYQDQQHYNDYPQPDQRAHPPPQRQYNYDERYHQHGQDRQPSGNGQRNNPQQPRQQRPPPPNEPRRQKPRERILAEPESPKSLAWDNPFGAFPAKKKEGDKKDSPPQDTHRRHGSMDAAAQRPKNWNSPPRQQGGPPDSRPHTSQDHRNPPRPNTSHGQRPQMSPPMNSDDRWGRSKADLVGAAPNQRPPIPSGDPRAGASRQMSVPRGPQPGQGQRPPMPPMGDPRPVPPQRAVTQPDISNSGLGPVNGHDYQQHGRGQFDIVTDRRPPPNRQASGHSYDREPERGPPLAKARTFDQGPRSPDMPNFDAMAPNVSETLTGPAPSDEPIYAKKSYQALAVNPNAGHYAQPQETTTSPLAEFAFGLPHSNSAPSLGNQLTSPPPMANSGARGYTGGPMTADIDYNNPPLSPPIPAGAGRQRNYDPRIAPPSTQNGQGRATPAQQFPVRGASRGEPTPAPGPYGSDPQDSGYWTSPDRNQPHPRDVVREHGYDEFAQGPDFNQGHPEQDYQNGVYDQYGQGPPAQQGYPPNGTMGGPLRPHTSNSAHPAPVRHQGPVMPPSGAGGMDRPPPFRPGLMNQAPPQPQPTPQPQQPMMRQAPPQQQPPPPQQMRQQQPPMGSAPADPRRQSNQSDDTKPAVTIAELNQMREQFKDKPNDFALGLRFAKRLVEAAKVLSSENGRADPKTIARNRERYINDAHKVVKKMVAAGSTDAMFYLADNFGQGGLGLPVDAKEAFALYQSAAKLNHPQSAYRVAVCCELGHEEGGGTRRDPMKAIQWYKRSATLGDTPAMYKMGMILLKGLLGQPRNPREAVSWLKRAAERADKENPHALHELGLLYESARPEDHILRDEAYAFQLFHQAAELGYKYSQFRLGSAFEYGALGMAIDQRQSIAWYSRAAAQGEHQSELALSGWYLTGAGDLVRQNDQEAFLWARKAAMSGLAKAEFAMGYFSENGIGCGMADVEEAKRWYYRAAAQGFPKARERLEELKMGAKGKKRDIRRSNRKEGDCVVM